MNETRWTLIEDSRLKFAWLIIILGIASLFGIFHRALLGINKEKRK